MSCPKERTSPENNMQDQKIKAWNLPPAFLQKWCPFWTLIRLILWANVILKSVLSFLFHVSYLNWWPNAK